MTQKAYAAGSPLPPLADGTLRVYSMRFCPFAQRTLLTLNHLNIPHEIVNINLKSKPEWFLEKNPLGLVPVLEQGDKIVYESAICNEYLEDVYGHKKLLSGDAYVKARTKILMEVFSKVIEKFYGLIRATSDDEKKKQTLEIAKPLKTFEENLHGKFFGGEELSMLDLHIFPWFERFAVLELVTGVNVLPADTFPRLAAWVKSMLALPAIKATVHDPKLHVEFLKPYLAGGIPDYDVGL